MAKSFILVLSPKILPPVFSLLGSIAKTATFLPLLVRNFPNDSIKVLFPTPGTPETAMRKEFPVLERQAVKISSAKS